jgi:hypothetical protein
MQRGPTGCSKNKPVTISLSPPIGGPARNAMKPLLFLANSFINTFGITQPSPEAAGRAAKFIAALIGLAILAMISVGLAVLYLMTR